jgi:hypothetical protein
MACDGKITGAHGVTYSLVDDKIVDAAGTIVGYLSQFKSPTQGTGALADKLFRSRE